MKKKNILSIIKLFIVNFLLIGYSQLIFGQLVISDQAEFFVAANGIVGVNGNLTIDQGGTLNMNGQEITVEGDLIQNGNFVNPVGVLKFTGIDTQTVAGNFEAANTIFDLMISQQDENSHVNLQTNVEVLNTLEFESGKIITNTNELYLKNDSENAITGHFIPNLTDGTFISDDRYVEGNLSRDVDPSVSTTYIFPIGSSEDFYNPLQLENLSGDVGKITASFSSTGLGPMNFTGEVDCSTDNPAYSGSASGVAQSNEANTDVEYSAMTGQGVWDISSGSSYDYDLIAYPNASNANVNPSTTGQYRLLKRPSEDDPLTDWTPFALSGNACINSTNFFELVGTDFSDFSIFGIVASESPVLPVELIQLSAQGMDNEYIKIEWETASEINNLGFEIERSRDGQTFEKIGWEDGSSENGDKYFFDDHKVSNNLLYYYRLKQIDLDGKYEYSPIVTAKILGDFEIEIYPNPTYDLVNIQISNDLQKEALSIEIYDMLGRKIFADLDYFKGRESSQFSFQKYNLAKGVYFLKIRKVNQEIASKKLVFY